MIQIKKNVPLVIHAINNFRETLDNKKPTSTQIEVFITKEIDFLLENKQKLLQFDFADVTLFSFDEKSEDEKSVASQKILALHSVAKDILVMMPKIIISVRKEVLGDPLPSIVARIFEASVKDFTPVDDMAIVDFVTTNNADIETQFDFLCDTKTSMYNLKWYDIPEKTSTLVSEEIMFRMETAELFLNKVCQIKAKSNMDQA